MFESVRLSARRGYLRCDATTGAIFKRCPCIHSSSMDFSTVFSVAIIPPHRRGWSMTRKLPLCLCTTFAGLPTPPRCFDEIDSANVAVTKSSPQSVFAHGNTRKEKSQ
jgi:hypothetical protein